MKHVFVALSVAGLALVCSTASAEEKQEKNVITMKPTTVVGNPRRPTAAIEVSKVRMQLGATTPTLTSVMKIQDASKKEPF